MGSAVSHRPERTASLPAKVTRGETQNHFYEGLERQSRYGEGGSTEIQEKPGSIKLQAQGSSDGDFPSVSFVSGPRDEVNSSAICRKGLVSQSFPEKEKLLQGLKWDLALVTTLLPQKKYSSSTFLNAWI